MNTESGSTASAALVARYGMGLCLAWSAVIGFSLAVNVAQARRQSTEAARIQARSAFEKDLLYRRWNAMHGGVYAPVTEQTPPNPCLDPEGREIATPSGQVLTKVNPAYMTRQVHELGQEHSRVQGHITSLMPIRPENAADEWEAGGSNSSPRAGRRSAR